jgi:hypothetical protein
MPQGVTSEKIETSLQPLPQDLDSTESAISQLKG